MKAVLLPVIILFFFGCSKDRSPSVAEAVNTTPYTIAFPLHFPHELNIPADNPMTVEGITLGRYLFYDGRLAGSSNPDSMMCCATCHIQSHSFVCGIDHPVFTGGHPHGLSGIPTSHFMLPLINLVWTAHGYLWNGSVAPGNPLITGRQLEDIVWMTVVAPDEMNSDTNRSKKMISGIPGYRDLFKKAFGPGEITMKNISKAIAQFVRTLITSNSRFDRFMKGEVQLTPPELHGYELFMTEQGADCFHCHGGDGNPLFTSNLFYNNGKDSVFNDMHDRYHYTGATADIGAYKAPSLRNLVFTAPYMHDGRFRSLDEVIDFYSSGLVYTPFISPLMHHISYGGVQLTPSEKSDLKAFLLTLTDSSFVSNPGFSDPGRMPGM